VVFPVLPMSSHGGQQLIKKLALLGATGDLAGRFLLPALAALRAADRLPDDFQVIAAAREDLTCDNPAICAKTGQFDPDSTQHALATALTRLELQECKFCRCTA
jgi:glucose-6-phosphate 1-dehydrogenase